MSLTTDERLDLHGITSDVRHALRQAGEVILPHLDRVLDGFYDQVRSNPSMSGHFKDDEMMGRARKAQIAHWTRLLSGDFDEAYMDATVQIGEVHHRIGLDPSSYVAVYSWFESQLQRILITSGQSRLGRFRADHVIAMLDAFPRAKNMDIELTITTMMLAQKRDFADHLKTLADAFRTEIGSVSQTVSTAAQQLSQTAEGMQGNTRSAMSRSDNAVSSIGQAASNLMSVSAAADELRASIHSISDQVREAQAISELGARHAAETDALVQALKTSGDEINGVVELISDVASQTNLLALNASVEAARAGEAGKGFAVVAGEVKQLSLRISEATDDIGRKISQMASDTTQAVTAIGQIAGTIHKLAAISSAIAVSVEEQRQATQDIATHATTTAGETELITQNIEAVGTVIRDASSTSDEVITAARELTQQSDVLNSEVTRFLNGFRAA